MRYFSTNEKCEPSCTGPTSSADHAILNAVKSVIGSLAKDSIEKTILKDLGPI